MAHVGLTRRDPCECKVKGFYAISSIKRNVSMKHLKGCDNPCDNGVVAVPNDDENGEASNKVSASIHGVGMEDSDFRCIPGVGMEDSNFGCIRGSCIWETRWSPR